MNIERKKYGGYSFSSKENAETGKQSGQSDRKWSTNEKQPEILVKGNDVEDNAYIERTEKNTELNNAVHALEYRFKRFNSMLRAGVLAAAMMISPSSAQVNQQESHNKGRGNIISAEIFSKAQEAHETHRHQDEQKAINTLNKIFNNGEEILRACGGVIEGETYQENENAPTFIHIGQNHGDNTHNFNPEMYFSQYYATECMVSMIKGNATGKVLPIGMEFLLPPGSEEERLELLIADSLINTIKFKGHGNLYFYDENNNENKDFNDGLFNQFPYSVRPEQLQDLEQPPISIMKRLAPEKMKAVLPEDITNRKTIKFSETVLKLMKILHEIEEDYNVRFIVADSPLSDNYKSNNDYSLRESYEDVFTKRENYVADSLRSLAKKYDTKVAISLFGSGHDFRDDVVGKGMNFMRVETSPSGIHGGTFNYENLYRSKFDYPAARCHMPLRAGDMKEWITGKGGAARVKDYLQYTKQFDFLFHHIHDIQRVLKSDSEEFTSDELFAIISEDIRNHPSVWSHRVYGGLSRFQWYLSPEHIAAIREMTKECKIHATKHFGAWCSHENERDLEEEIKYYGRLFMRQNETKDGK